MPTREHEIWLELIQERPTLAADLLDCVRPDTVPVHTHARVESADLNDHKPTEYRADTVVSLRDEHDDIVAAVIIEVQRRKDFHKRWSWPAYLATLRARLHCPVLLLVISPRRDTAAWCVRPIALGHPGLTLTPLVLGPDQVPAVTDPCQAQDNPELAVLSALVHGDGDDGEKVLTAMLHGLDHLKIEQAQGYIDEVLAMLPVAARQILEAMMRTGTREYKSEYARHYFGQGKAQGIAEGKAEGEAKMLLLVLAGRGIEVPEDARARILECTDLERIEHWGRRAGTVDTIDELFD